MHRIFATFATPFDRGLLDDVAGLKVAYESENRIAVDVECDMDLIEREIINLCSTLLDRGITKFEVSHYAC